MKKFLKGLLASFVLLTSLSAVADQVLVIDAGYSTVTTNVQGRLQAAGHTVTVTTDISNIPTGTGTYQQVWDLRYSAALTSGETTNYTQFVTAGGFAYFVTENPGCCMSRNNSVAALITGLGGGSTQIGPGWANNVESNVNTTYMTSGITVNYAAVAAIVNSQGIPLISDGSNVVSGMSWIGRAGALGSGVTGTIVTVADTNWLDSTRFAVGGTTAQQQNVTALDDIIRGIVAGTVAGTISSSGNGAGATNGNSGGGQQAPTTFDHANASENVTTNTMTAGAFTGNGGTLTANSAALTVTNPITLSTGGLTYDANGQNSTLDGVISGSGGATFTGSGVTTLTATNTYTGSTTINSGANLVNNGSIASSSGVLNNGTFTNNGAAPGVTNNGTFTNGVNGTAASLTNAGTATNNGTITGTVTNNSGTFTNAGTTGDWYNAATVNNTGTMGNGTNVSSFTNGGTVGTVQNNTGGTFTNNGTTGAVANNDTFTNNQGATTGAVANTGTFTNAGTTGEVTGNTGTFTNSGTTGAVTNNTNGTFNNSGTTGDWINNGTVTNTGTMGNGTNYVTFTNGGTVGTVDNQGTFTNNNTTGVVTNTGTFTNSGTTTTVTNNTNGVFTNSGTTGDWTNYGTVTNTGTMGNGINYITFTNNNTVGTVDNQGTFTNSGTTGNLTNSGTFVNSGNVGTVTNSGTFTYNGGTIGAVTNSGTFDASGLGSNVSLSNYTQTAGSTILNGTQKLNVSGAANLGGNLTILNGPTALGKYTYVTGAPITGTYGSYTGTGVLRYTPSGVQVWVMPDGTVVQGQVNNQANNMNTMNSLASSSLTSALGSECYGYGATDSCISINYGNTKVASGDLNSGGVTVVKRFDPNWRAGVYTNESFNQPTVGNIKYGAKGPAWGGFVGWAEGADGLGFGAQLAAITGKGDYTIGSNKTPVQSDAIQIKGTYSIPLNMDTTFTDYIGLRYSQFKVNGYTEQGPVFPLTYGSINQTATDLIVGASVTKRLTDNLTGNASVGVLQNLNYNAGSVNASSDMGNFTSKLSGGHYTSASLGAGLTYEVAKDQRVGANVGWQQRNLYNANITSYGVSYTVGF